MLSRVANLGKRAVRRFATEAGGGANGAPPKPSTPQPIHIPSKVPATWQATKAILDRGSLGTRLACAVVLAVSGATIYEQYHDQTSSSELMKSMAHLSENVVDTPLYFMRDSQQISNFMAQGLLNLPDLLAVHRRSFSGDVIIPVNVETLKRYELPLLSSLLKALDEQYDNRWRALTMLHTLAKASPSVRDRLRETYSMHLIMETGTHFSTLANPHHEWLVAADLVTLLLTDPEAQPKQLEDLKELTDKFMSKYGQSTNPVAALVYSRLGDSIGVPVPSTGFSKDVESRMITQAVQDSLAIDYTQRVSGASIFSAVGFALLGGAWGRLRWAMRLASKGALNSHAWNWSSKKHIARPLALWFMLDMLGQQLLTFASNDKFEFDQRAVADIAAIEARANLSGMTLTTALQHLSGVLAQVPGTQNVSLATALSLVQNASFTVFSLWMITTRRYAFFPLAAAGIYNHYGEVSKIPQLAYVIDMGKLQAEEAKKRIW